MDGWARMGAMVKQERSRRWRSRAEFARAAGISARTIDDVETGRRSNFSDVTLASIEAALEWEPGTCRRLVEGGRVRRDRDRSLLRLLELWPRLSADARALLVAMAEQALERASEGDDDTSGTR